MTNDSVYTVAEAGLYLISAHVVTIKQLSSAVGPLAPYIQCNNSANAVKQRVYGTVASSASTFPTINGTRGEVTGIMQLSVGDTIRIRVTNQSTSVTGIIASPASSPAAPDKPTRLVIVKLI